jgi:hypothetical protein
MQLKVLWTIQSRAFRKKIQPLIISREIQQTQADIYK